MNTEREEQLNLSMIILHLNDKCMEGEYVTSPVIGSPRLCESIMTHMSSERIDKWPLKPAIC